MNRKDTYNADQPARIADENDEGVTRTPPYSAEDACKALHDVAQAHGRIIELPSGPPADLTHPLGVMCYLLELASRGVQFCSPLDRLGTAVEYAVSQAHTSKQVKSANKAALLAVSDAVRDLDRTLARELREAEVVIKQLAAWIADTNQQVNLKSALRRSAAQPASLVFFELAIATLSEDSDLSLFDTSTAHLVRSGCTLPPELAQQMCALPFHGAAAIHESLIVWLDRPDIEGQGLPSTELFCDRSEIYLKAQNTAPRRRYTSRVHRSRATNPGGTRKRH